LSSASHRILKLPDIRRTTQLWQNIGRKVGPAHFGQAGGKKLKHPLFGSIYPVPGNRRRFYIKYR